MGDVLSLLTPLVWALGISIALLAGFVKGAVGFAMPMVMISGLSSITEPQLALAILILPTLFTNAWQALRSGIASARAAVLKHWRYLTVVLVMVALSAQLIRILPDAVLFLVLGVPITVFAFIQLAGLRFSIPPRRRVATEVGIGGFAGFVGGLSGVWGPPTVLYLTALETPKVEQMQVQGIVYGLGAVVLTAAHINSGVVTTQTAALSALFVLPALIGTRLGFALSDRMDQARFRKLTLAVLVIAGLNLVRRGLLAL